MPQRDTRLIGGIYRIGQTITAGGMLTTATAYNHNTNDVVGLYVLNIPSTDLLDTLPALLRPYEKRRGINSPHILRVLDWGMDGTRIYIATDPPRGITLQHVLDTENINLPRALDFCRQLTIGLKALHAADIFGLDLRPQLITVDTLGIQDRVQIDDIGLRSLLQQLRYVPRQSNEDIGYLDPRYAPPEYINHQPSRPQSDIYQAGLLLFTLVTGRLPFVGRTTAETGILQTSSPVPSMRVFKHQTPDEVQQLVERAMAKDPARRFSNADELLMALEQVQKQTQRQSPVPGATSNEKVAELDRSISYTAEISQAEMEAALKAPVKRTKSASSADAAKAPRSMQPLPANLPTSQGVYAYLCFEQGDYPQRIALTQPSTIIGRLDPKRGLSPDLDLSHIDPKMSISRQHARIRFEGTFFTLEDLKSRNKTRMEDQVLTPLKPELLNHGAQISFGSVRLHFEVPGMESRQPHKPANN
ncbi:FHA domain-containing serine/threonine-protein kinase [Dictyobacter aurantiacus]|uniref:non-specific serine/threonine protein kinase n=1 Tax=Dictyobacter aurantiacus TaxID=1936993 RepID=A0A401Z849_9CHLR|nr:FHA domain-containing serine/threonine-protein kinase [Dictyobacter aurantiacus]GCE03034.1 hypothetical protein KDAU_03630 [Dictyobacter aurantiacus]